MQNIVIDYKKCRSCGVCQIACPQKLIGRYESGSVFVKQFEAGYADYCFVCQNCIKICPEKAIIVIDIKCDANEEYKWKE